MPQLSHIQIVQVCRSNLIKKMENRNSFLLCFSLGIFLLLLTHANAESISNPWANPNLSPFEQWRSAYFCMQNTTSTDCSDKDTLTSKGWLSVQESEIKDYCGRCYAQTLIVMNCIQDVHRHFKFESGAPLAFVMNATMKACEDLAGFNTSYKIDPNSATSLQRRLYLPLVSTITTMALIATFT